MKAKEIMDLVDGYFHHQSMEDTSRDVYYSGFDFKATRAKLQAFADQFERLTENPQ